MLRAVGVPSVQCHGSTDAWHFVAMERLGPSLEDLFTYCRRRFTLKTVLMIADQVVRGPMHRSAVVCLEACRGPNPMHLRARVCS